MIILVHQIITIIPTRIIMVLRGNLPASLAAIGDAIAAIKTPVVEVHISNVHAREDFRKLSHVSGKSVGSIFGLGLKGYELALEYFISNSPKK